MEVHRRFTIVHVLPGKCYIFDEETDKYLERSPSSFDACEAYIEGWRDGYEERGTEVRRN